MALILAIEADRKQASTLAALARDPLRAELVLGETTDQAFSALGGRQPDLILTSLLLSPKDEAALADRVRELDAAGWRVQTLVIPVLGTPSGRGKESAGLLTRLRRAAPRESGSRGCDPAIFAEQVSEYLERAAAERAVALEDAAHAAAATPAPEPEGFEAVVEELAATFADLDEPVVVGEEPVATPDEPVVVPEEPVVTLETALEPLESIEPVIDKLIDVPVDLPVDPVVELPSDLSLPVTGLLLDEPIIELPDIEIITAASFDEPAVDERRWEAFVVTAEPPVESAATAEDLDVSSLVIQAEPIDLARFMAEFGPPIVEPSAPIVIPQPAAASAFAAPALVVPPMPASVPRRAFAQQPADAMRLAWAWPRIEGASSEQDLADFISEQLDQPGEDELVVVAAAPPRKSQEAKSGRKRSAEDRKRKPQTPQDEWGFFDPEQCGFAALVAKLDEIAAAEPKEPARD